MSAINMLGQKIGRWTVVARGENDKHGQARWECRCDCGVEVEVLSNHLRNGTSKSCGCATVERMTKHGMFGSKTYDAWAKIIARCTNKKSAAYHNYGGRGIKVCERWRESFAKFFSDMGESPERHDIDRVNNDGDYEPNNCRWVTRTENSKNRRSSKWWFIGGVRYDSAPDAAKDLEVGITAIHRMCRGYTSRGNYYPPKPGCYSTYKYRTTVEAP